MILSKDRVPIYRPSWDDYFMGLAILASTRSHDAQTKHGCILVKDNIVIGTGYNGFPKGFDDDVLPNVRPGKYFFMFHSEVNAIANASCDVNGCKCYVTGQPCSSCLKTLYQFGIKHIVILDNPAHMLLSMSNEEADNYNYFVEKSGIKIDILSFDGKILEQALSNFRTISEKHHA